MNLNRKGVLSLVLVGFMATNFSGCASKSKVSPSSSKDECGEGTTAQGSILGAVLGGTISFVTGGNEIATTIATGVGAGIGAIGGYLLSEMQCNYHGQERRLIKQINISKKNQEKLSNDSSDLNKKITALSNEMGKIDARKEMSNAKKGQLLSSINQKSKSIIALQKENSNSRGRVLRYSKSVDNYKYRDNDKKSLKESLSDINNEQDKIARGCVNNLKKLKELERRIIS